MAAHITTKDAARMGLTAPRAKRTPYLTRCVKCGVTFDTMAGETRHMTDTGHRRFELVL